MPYLYQLADESSRNRPSHAAAALSRVSKCDGGRTSHRYRWGCCGGVHARPRSPDRAIPYPEEPDAYTVEFPSRDWYDYWTGAKCRRTPAAFRCRLQAPPSSIQVQPELAALPVFVRAGAILPSNRWYKAPTKRLTVPLRCASTRETPAAEICIWMTANPTPSSAATR